jgi:hypothetical protein
MPDAVIILFLAVLAIVAIIALFKGIKSDCGTSAGVFVFAVLLWGAVFTWLRVADVNRKPIVDWFFLHTITCNDGTTIQVFMDGDQVGNATQLLGKLYPDNGWVIERRILEPMKYGISFDNLENEASYRAIAPNEGSSPNKRIEDGN